MASNLRGVLRGGLGIGPNTSTTLRVVVVGITVIIT